jgi:hypothetical protein
LQSSPSPSSTFGCYTVSPLTGRLFLTQSVKALFAPAPVPAL